MQGSEKSLGGGADSKGKNQIFLKIPMWWCGETPNKYVCKISDGLKKYHRRRYNLKYGLMIFGEKKSPKIQNSKFLKILM